MKKEEEKTLIQIPEIKIKKARLKIVGDSPIIINKFSEKAKAEILNKQLKKPKERAPKIPFQEFMNRLYWITEMPDITGKTEEEMQELFEEALKKGARFGFPSVAIKQSAISSAYRGGLAKNKVSLQGMFHIEGELVEIKGDLSMREDYVKIPMAGADIVFRGEFAKGWSAEFNVMFDESTISLEQIVQMINLGGFSVGIGDWRVEKGGNYGMFHVE